MEETGYLRVRLSKDSIDRIKKHSKHYMSTSEFIQNLLDNFESNTHMLATKRDILDLKDYLLALSKAELINDNLQG